MMLFLTLFCLACSPSGVSSFNQFIHELAVDSDVSSVEYSSGEEYDEDDDDDGYDYPETPSSAGSRASSRASFTNYSRNHVDWIQYILLWILVSVKFLLGIPFRLFQLVYSGLSKPRSISENQHAAAQSHLHAKVQSLKDQIIHRTTDRRRGIIEVVKLFLSLLICLLYYIYIFFVDDSHVHLILSIRIFI